jgi:hypothetical protein
VLFEKLSIHGFNKNFDADNIYKVDDHGKKMPGRQTKPLLGLAIKRLE